MSLFVSNQRRPGTMFQDPPVYSTPPIAPSPAGLPRRGMFGAGMGGDTDTLQLAMQAAVAKMGQEQLPQQMGQSSGLPAPVPTTAPDPQRVPMASEGGNVPALVPPPRLGGMFANQPAAPGFDANRYIGQEPKAPKKVDWQLLLGALGAALQNRPDLAAYYGQQARARRDNYQNALAQRQRAMSIASLPGMTEREFATYTINPEAWAKANSTRYEAATLGEKDSRVFGDPNSGGSVYQAPRFIENGVDTVQVDPMGTMPPRTVYSGMTDAEQFARGMDLEPGTDPYNQAQQDYVLRGNGPTAFGYDANLEGVRQGNRVGLENLRQQNRVGLRQTPSYAATHPRPRATGPSRPTVAGVIAPILAKVSRGERLTPGEQQAYSMYRPGRGGGKGSSPAGGGGAPTATDPKTGRKVRWNGSAWVPAS